MKKVAFLYLWNPASYFEGGASLEITYLKKYLEKLGVCVDYRYIFEKVIFGPWNYLNKFVGTYQLFLLSKKLSGYDAIIGFDPIMANGKTKTIRFFQGNDFRGILNNLSIGATNQIYRVLLDLLTLNKHDKIAAVSNATKKDIRELYRVKKEVTVIHGGIDFKIFRPLRRRDKLLLRRGHGYHDEDLLVLSVGVLTRGKGFLKLIKVARRFPKLKFLIIGDGGLKTRILAEKSRNVRIISGIPNTQINQYYQIADFFILLSKHEGFPMVLREAAAVALPLISTDVGDCSLLVRNNHNGFITTRDEDEISNKITQLIEHPDLQRAFSQNSLNLMKKFTWQQAAEKLLKIINE